MNTTTEGSMSKLGGKLFRSVTAFAFLYLGFVLIWSSPLCAQVQEAWVIEAGGLFADHETYALTVDKTGNVYVAGNDGTVKYDTDGHQLWMVGPTNDFDPGVVIAVDSAASVYVAADIGLAKYDALGNRLWLDYLRDLGNTIDYPFAMTLDDSGNVYVTGRGGTAGTGDDYVTAKYDGDGNELWSVRYDGPAHSFDSARGLAIDASGNCYVTGASTGTNSNLDYATIKYDANGNQLWVARHNGLANHDDYANGIAVDSMGNVYVTGTTDYNTTFSHYTTIKYDTDGNQVWLARYSYTNSADNKAAALAVDASGNVYVAGSCQEDCFRVGFGLLHDYVTVKYDANGNQLWARAYDGDGFGCNEDYPVALITDKEGNVYVSGVSEHDPIFGGGGFGTVKYDTDGNELWRTLRGPPGGLDITAGGFAVDAVGNVYVTGYGCTDLSCGSATIKYLQGPQPPTILVQPQNRTVLEGTNTSFSVSVNGTPPFSFQWVFDGMNLPGATNSASVRNSTFTLFDVRATNAGDYLVVITNAIGMTTSSVARLTVLLSPPTITSQPQRQTVPSGDTVLFSVAATGAYPLVYQWFFNGTNLTSATNAILSLNKVQPSDSGDYWAMVSNAYGSATSTVAHLTVQLPTSGVQLAWVARDAPVPSRPGAMAVDNAGNVYLTGLHGSDLVTHTAIYVTAKYDASGEQVWLQPYNGETSALAVDSVGNVYVTGAIDLPCGGCDGDYGTIKYGPNGNQLWLARYDGTGQLGDRANAIALDNAGNTYVTGRSQGTRGNDDYATVKYDANGSQLWVRRYTGPGFGNHEAKALALDKQGNFYVTGYSEGIGSFNYDYATVKYDPSGAQLWVRRYDDPAHGEDVALAIAIDPEGNAWVTGDGSGSCTTIKYDTNGLQRWIRTYTNAIYAVGWSIALHGAAYGYVAGVTRERSDESSDSLAIKYDANGKQLWAAQYQSPRNGDAGAAAVAVDTDGYAYFTGGSSGNTWTCTTIKYDAEGHQQWVADYENATGVAITLDNSGNVLVSAQVLGGSGVLLKYTQPPVTRLNFPSLLSNGQFQFTLIGAAAKTYEIQSSEDLMAWITVTNFVGATGTNVVTDLAGSAQRFYRAVTR